MLERDSVFAHSFRCKQMPGCKHWFDTFLV